MPVVRTRIGKCKQCGKCCNFVGFHAKVTDEALEWSKARKIQIEPCDKDCKLMQILIPNKCPQLKDNKCGLQDCKPVVCKNYPNHPNQLLPGCGFSFKEVVNGK